MPLWENGGEKSWPRTIGANPKSLCSNPIGTICLGICSPHSPEGDLSLGTVFLVDYLHLWFVSLMRFKMGLQLCFGWTDGSVVVPRWTYGWIYLGLLCNTGPQLGTSPKKKKKKLANTLDLNTEATNILSRINGQFPDGIDLKWWCLASNGKFSVKSFYWFLNDRGLCCQVSLAFWKSACLWKFKF